MAIIFKISEKESITVDPFAGTLASTIWLQAGESHYGSAIEGMEALLLNLLKAGCLSESCLAEGRVERIVRDTVEHIAHHYAD